MLVAGPDQNHNFFGLSTDRVPVVCAARAAATAGGRQAGDVDSRAGDVGQSDPVSGVRREVVFDLDEKTANDYTGYSLWAS